MTIRIIKYIPKVTSARTQYVDIDQNDMTWLQSELIRWLALLGEIDGHRNTDLRQVMKHWWYKRTPSLPKGVNGQNSPLTFTSGLVNNLMFGSQRDLSSKALDAIENISSQIVLLEQALVSDLNINTSSIATNIKFAQAMITFNIPQNETLL
jgi:hypothetical protein